MNEYLLDAILMFTLLAIAFGCGFAAYGVTLLANPLWTGISVGVFVFLVLFYNSVKEAQK